MGRMLLMKDDKGVVWLQGLWSLWHCDLEFLGVSSIFFHQQLGPRAWPFFKNAWDKSDVEVALWNKNTNLMKILDRSTKLYRP